RECPVTFARPSFRTTGRPMDIDHSSPATVSGSGVRDPGSGIRGPGSGGFGLPWSEPLAISKPESGAIAGLVVYARAQIPRVSGVRLFELPLSLEIPVAAVDPLVLLASLASLCSPPLVAGLIGPRRVPRFDGAGCRDRAAGRKGHKLVARDDAVAILVHALERRRASGPLAA